MIACSLHDLPADLRHAIEFCPECRKVEFPWYLLCGEHSQAQKECHTPEVRYVQSSDSVVSGDEIH
jgi:hypothetical protein